MLAWIAVAGLSYATFGREHVRQLAFRWRPVSEMEVVNGELVMASNHELRRYTRVMHALERHSQAFGILSDDDDALHIFVLHADAERHVLDAILWHPGATSVQRKIAMRDMRYWHRRCFLKDVELGSGLERADRALS